MGAGILFCLVRVLFLNWNVVSKKDRADSRTGFVRSESFVAPYGEINYFISS